MKSHIQTRIILAFSILLLAIQLASMLTINTLFSTSQRDEIKDELRRGERIFSLLLDNNYRQLTRSASIMSSDFAFRKSIALADKDTIQSVLANHSTRLDANLLLLLDLEGDLIATTMPSSNAARPEVANLFSLIESQGQALTSAVINGQLMQLVAVPVLGPLPMAWLVAGFNIDTPFVETMKSVTSTHISFMGRNRESQKWELFATSLPQSVSDLLPGYLDDRDYEANPEAIYSLAAGDDHYQTLLKPLRKDPGLEIVAVIQQSLNEALAPLKEIQRYLFALGFASLAAVVMFSFLLARGISRPIIRLSKLANNIRRGDYTESAPVEQSDEIGDLALAFNHMKENIAEREARISNLAYKDQLTALPNRIAFHERLSEVSVVAGRTGQSAALLLINLDRMMEVNTTLGHDFGDHLLMQVAERLAGLKRSSDDMVARLGGDEFVLLLMPCDRDCAINATHAVLQALDKPVVLRDQEILPTGSIGIALYPEHGIKASELLRRADIAMYRAKADNSSSVVFEPAFENSGKNLSLLAELRHAIGKNEFQLFYQPKLSAAGDDVTQFEALLRWQHPERGAVPPGEFIPHAEQTGYIRNITLWVMEAALRQCRLWREQQLPLTIAINISTRDLTNLELPRLFETLLAKHNCLPHWLCLEITESAIMADARRSLSVLQSLHDLGFRLSIDDFGTGYSSMSYLKSLPVSELKIDQSFIFNIANNVSDQAIVRSLVSLGHSTGLKVTAEGVEDEEALRLLRELGCDYTQGYFHARPMPASEVSGWLASQSWKKSPP